jgi:hypothetical protein
LLQRRLPSYSFKNLLDVGPDQVRKVRFCCHVSGLSCSGLYNGGCQWQWQLC